MSRWQVYLIAGAVLLATGFGLGLAVSIHRQSHKAQVIENQANQAEGAALAHQAAAQLSDRQADHDQATVTTSDAHAAAAKRELDRRLAALHGDAPASHQEGLPNLPGIPDSSSELKATQAALAQAQVVIADQQSQIEARDKLIASLTTARDNWKASAEQAQEALRLQQIAHDAQMSAQAKRTVWGEIKTGAAMALIGYAAGRKH